MKVCRFTVADSAPRYGALVDDSIAPLLNIDPFAAELSLSAERIPLDAIKFLPAAAPSKIVCVGRNYRAHAAELGNDVPAEPLLFLKAPSSLIAADEPIVLPPQSDQVEHEGELGVVIKRRCKNLSEQDDPLAYVFGYLPLNDVTARDLQRRDGQFARAKSFDTFCPVGNWIETELEPTNLELTVRVNETIKQSGNTAQMVFPVADLIRYVSRQMTLLPGDLLATGTPAGVSILKPGDTVSIEIERVGVLSNPVTQ